MPSEISEKNVCLMKYRFNTRLACFACIPDRGKIPANITWYRFEAQDKYAVCFT